MEVTGGLPKLSRPLCYFWLHMAFLFRSHVVRRACRAAFCAALGLSVAVVLGACSGSLAPDAEGSGARGGSGGGAGSGGAPAPSLGFHLEDGAGNLIPAGSGLTLAPNQESNLWVEARPPGTYRVRFALLGSPADGFLNTSELDTDDEGRAMVVLRTPSTPTDFRVRASTGGVAEELTVSVKQLLAADVEVTRSYEGRRDVDLWVASANLETTCDQLRGNPPPDGAFVATSAGQVVTLRGVPVQKPMAITLRGGHFAWGCANLQAATEGMRNIVQVSVTNVPMHFDGSQLRLELGLETDEVLRAELAPAITEALAAVLGEAEDDVAVLLDTMRSHVDASTTAFESVRDAQKWDLRLREALGSGAASALRDPLSRWLTAGLAGIGAELAVDATLAYDADAPESPAVTLHSTFGLEPERSDAEAAESEWRADATDNVLVHLMLGFNPTALLVGAAQGAAVLEVDGAESVEEALAESVPCGSVAETLVTYGSASLDCDAGCVEAACRDASAELVERAAAARAETRASLDIAATGPASVGDDAQVESLTGTWVGKLDTSGSLVDVGGEAIARTE